MKFSYLIRRHLPSVLRFKDFLNRGVINTSGKLKTTRGYIRERWRSTEPGLKWTYVLSIIAAILFVPYCPWPYLLVNLLIIPVTACALIQGGLRLRLLWLGLILFDVKQIFNLAIYYDFIFGIRPNDYIAFPMISVVLIRGFLSFDLRRTAEVFYERVPLKLVITMFLIIIVAFGIDFSFSLFGYDKYYSNYRNIMAITGTTQGLPIIAYLSVYIFVTIQILNRQYVGIVVSIVLLTASTLDWIAFRLRITDFNLFYLLDEIKDSFLATKYVYPFIFSYTLLLPVLAVVVVICFFIKIPDTVFPLVKRITRRK